MAIRSQIFDILLKCCCPAINSETAAGMTRAHNSAVARLLFWLELDIIPPPSAPSLRPRPAAPGRSAHDDSLSYFSANHSVVPHTLRTIELFHWELSAAGGRHCCTIGKYWEDGLFGQVQRKNVKFYPLRGKKKIEMSIEENCKLCDSPLTGTKLSG